MSAVVGEPAAGGSQKYVNFDEYVDFQVNKTRAGIRYTDLLLAVVTVLLVVAGYLLLFVVADQWLIEGGFSDWTRTGLLAAVVGFIGVWTMILATRSLSRILRFCSAGKKPGQSELTRTPFWANSRATFLV